MFNIEAIKAAVAAAAKEQGAEGYEISIESNTSAGAEALKDEINSVTYTRSGSISVRCIKNGKSGYASGDLVTPEEAAVLVARAVGAALAVDDVDEVPLFEGSESYREVEKDTRVLPSADELKKHTLEMQTKLYAASDKIVDGSQSFTACQASEEAFFNSAGLSLEYSDSIVYHGVSAAIKDGDEAEDDYAMGLIEKEDADKVIDRAVSSALSKLGADAVPSGKYDIVLDSDAMRSLLSAFSTVFSAKSAFLKTTRYAGKEGEKVASDVLTIVDDPFHPEKFGRCPFDGEGVAVYAKNVIENGVLKTLLYNRMYAKKLGKETTGNASSAKNITPLGLYVAAGELSEDALFERLGNGLYITDFQGIHAGANPQSGDFSLQAKGFVIENGKKGAPVKNVTVADNFFEFLGKVDAVSDKVDFGPVSRFGSPNVLFKGITVSGK